MLSPLASLFAPGFAHARTRMQQQQHQIGCQQQQQQQQQQNQTPQGNKHNNNNNNNNNAGCRRRLMAQRSARGLAFWLLPSCAQPHIFSKTCGCVSFAHSIAEHNSSSSSSGSSSK
jgi:hypothetical protein